MKTIYLDSDFKCHITNDGTMTAFETSFFDDKCNTLIEGYCLIPAGQEWKREDGEIFHGETIFPWKDYAELKEAQEEYEFQLKEEYKSSLKIMGVVFE